MDMNIYTNIKLITTTFEHKTTGKRLVVKGDNSDGATFIKNYERGIIKDYKKIRSIIGVCR